jgi:hypothetical protein
VGRYDTKELLRVEFSLLLNAFLSLALSTRWLYDDVIDDDDDIQDAYDADDGASARAAIEPCAIGRAMSTYVQPTPNIPRLDLPVNL